MLLSSQEITFVEQTCFCEFSWWCLFCFCKVKTKRKQNHHSVDKNLTGISQKPQKRGQRVPSEAWKSSLSEIYVSNDLFYHVKRKLTASQHFKLILNWGTWNWFKQPRSSISWFIIGPTILSEVKALKALAGERILRCSLGKETQ